jgi:hypothetical protein
MKLGKMQSWNERHPSRSITDSKIIDHLRGFFGRSVAMIDLPGPGYARSFAQWSRMADRYTAVERDRKVHSYMKEVHQQVEYTSGDGTKNPELCHDDFWKVLLDGMCSYDVVKFCHTRTMRKLVEDEGLLENLEAAAESDCLNSRVAIIITVCRRDNTGTNWKKYIPRIKRAFTSKGWSCVKYKTFTHGNARNGEGNMATLVFVFDRPFQWKF